MILFCSLAQDFGALTMLKTKTFMFNPLHIFHRGRCARCGMSIEEIVRYDVLFCPAGNDTTLRAALSQKGLSETVVLDCGYDARKHGAPYS